MGASRFDEIIDSLKRLQQEIPDSLSLKDIKQDIGNTIQNINSPLLIMVMGEFSTGKSTFINALVGQDIAKVDAKPTTAVITKLVYGASDQITVVFRDGSRKEYDADNFAKLTAEGDDEANELHEKMDYVERAMPIEILKSMSIIDSPGLNSIKTVHEETTRRFMDNADTVIWLFDAHNPGRQTEIDALKRLNPRLSPLVLVNKIDTIDEDEGDSIEQVITGIERTLRNNKLEAQRIVGVSAKMAVQGQKKNNEKLVEVSRIADFYTAIEEVVLPRREEYKRNSLLDGLARIVFRVGNAVAEERSKTEALRDTDYTKYIETETSLAATNDELEIIAAGFVDELKQKPRLNAAEKTFLGVLYWLGLCVEKDEKTAQQYMEESAVRNDTIAQINLSEMCQKLGQDDKAKYWFGKLGLLDKLAAEMYQQGKLLEETGNHVAALEYYQKAIDAGNEDAKARAQEMQAQIEAKEKKEKQSEEFFARGENYYKVEHEYYEALQWYRKASEAGNKSADARIQEIQAQIEAEENKEKQSEEFFARGENYFKEGNYNEAMKWFLKAADEGNPSAMDQICFMYSAGRGVNENWVEAEIWRRKKLIAYKERAKFGNPDAMYGIGYLYEVGSGVDKDKSEAERWYRKALIAYKERAEDGKTDEMYRIGAMYEYGKGVDIKKEALNWYKKAADGGNVDAMVTIGHMYEYGIYNRIPKDEKEALEWYRKAADAGNEDAKIRIRAVQARIEAYKIDDMYKKGNQYYDNEQYSEALEWYRKAADKGLAVAMNDIGYLYENGKGVPQDYTKALEWYRKAYKSGNQKAADHIDHIEEYMQRVKTAEKKAAEARIEALQQAKPKSSGGSCYITTAVCNTLQKPDDCYELTMFRNFRDGWLKAQPDGERLIQDYYAIAPTIVANIDARKDAQETYCKIWKDYLSPCLAMLENGRNSECKSMYTRMVLELKKRFIH